MLWSCPAQYKCWEHSPAAGLQWLSVPCSSTRHSNRAMPNRLNLHQLLLCHNDSICTNHAARVTGHDAPYRIVLTHSTPSSESRTYCAAPALQAKLATSQPARCRWTTTPPTLQPPWRWSGGKQMPMRPQPPATSCIAAPSAPPAMVTTCALRMGQPTSQRVL